MRGALAQCDGVKDVRIDLDNRLATVIVDENMTDAEKLVNAVKAARSDFSDTTVKTN